MPIYNRKPFDSVMFLTHADVRAMPDSVKNLSMAAETPEFVGWVEAEAKRLFLLALDRYAEYLVNHANIRTNAYADESPYIREFLSYLDILMHEFPDIELGYAIIDKQVQVEQGYTIGSSFCPKCFHEMVEHWQHKHNVEHIGHTRQTLDMIADFLDEKPDKVH